MRKSRIRKLNLCRETIVVVGGEPEPRAMDTSPGPWPDTYNVGCVTGDCPKI